MNEPDAVYGYEPPPPERNWLLIGGAAALALMLLCLCAGGAVYLVTALQPAGPPPPAPVIPTLPPAAGAVTAAPGQPTVAPTQPGAPTVTLRPTATLPPAIGAANVIAVPMPAPPAIDGNFDDWPEGPTATSAFRVYSVAGWDGTDDLTAVWRLAWDAANLYVAVRVVDNIHVQNETGRLTYRGDSVELQIDTNRAGDFAPELSPDDFQFVLSPGDFAARPPSVNRFRGDAAGGIPEAPGHSARAAALRTGDGYTLEAALPWADLALTPAEGMVLGLALNANDNDTPGTAVQEVMMSHVSTRTLRDPTGWGTLTLQ